MGSDGDMQFGHSSADFWFNQPEAVGQVIKTRLLLFRGEWFLDTTEGTPWGGFPLNDAVVQQGEILGAHTQLTRDVAIKSRILSTRGVLSLVDYSSEFDPNNRRFTVNFSVNTIYGGLVGSGVLLGSMFTLDITPLDSTAPLG
jgi:hypothetical protein